MNNDNEGEMLIHGDDGSETPNPDYESKDDN